MNSKPLVLVRGAGDLATGIIQKFFRAGIGVVALESPQPTSIRRTVALSEAVYAGTSQVEDIRCQKISSPQEVNACLQNGVVPLMVDPQGDCIPLLRPTCIVDAILAKRNLGTHRGMAPITIALGPGFVAGQDVDDVDAVIETMRGHNLGRLILNGSALANTGIPGEIGGKSAQRVIHAPAAGQVRHCKQIGDIVQQGDILFYVDETPAPAPFTGLLRGLIRQGLSIPKGLKAADIDPRTDIDVYTISDKARCLGGATLEAYLYLCARKEVHA